MAKEINFSAKIDDSVFNQKNFNNLTTNTKTIVGAINEIAATSGASYIIGEYKWMPLGSNMPKGWIKIEEEGLMLINNIKGDRANIITNNTGDDTNISTIASGIMPPGYTDGFTVTYVRNDTRLSWKNVFLSAELWQYSPNNEVLKFKKEGK